MRDAFFRALTALYRRDRRVVFLTADLGYKLFDPLLAIDPQRVINVGVRENLMVSMAAGLAHRGLRPFAYSIVPFITLRSAEQIYTDICVPRLPVVLVGMGGGFSYGCDGPTHWGLHDLGVLLHFPGLALHTPATEKDVESLLPGLAGKGGPAYLRLERGAAPAAPRRVEQRPAINLLTYGSVAEEVAAAADCLTHRGLAVQVIRVPRLRPLTAAHWRRLIPPRRPYVTIEEHFAPGPLALLAAAYCRDAYGGGDGLACAVPADRDWRPGTRAWLLRQAKLTGAALAARINKWYDRRNRSGR